MLSVVECFHFPFFFLLSLPSASPVFMSSSLLHHNAEPVAVLHRLQGQRRNGEFTNMQLMKEDKNIIRSECFFVIRTEAYPNNRLVFSSCTHMTFVIFQICPYLVRLSVSIETIYNFVHNKSRLLVYWWKKMEPNVWFCWLITKFNHYEV